MSELGNIEESFADAGPVDKKTCSKCGGELKTLSAMVSDDERHYISAVECKECGHTATLKEPRTAPYKPVRAIV